MELKPGFALNNKTCYICAEAHILTGLFLVYVIFAYTIFLLKIIFGKKMVKKYEKGGEILKQKKIKKMKT